jgi:hypothetical protein
MEPMSEKYLLFYDGRSAENEILGRKAVHEVINELRRAYDEHGLSQPFSQELFLSLINQGTACLNESAKETLKSWYKTLKAPKIYGQINFLPNFESLIPILSRVKQTLKKYEINPYTIDFDGPDPILTDSIMDKIRDGYKHYASTDGEKKLFKLVQDYCETSNKLEAFIDENGYPSFLLGIGSINGALYLNYFNETMDKVVLSPNLDMIERLKAIMAIGEKAKSKIL